MPSKQNTKKLSPEQLKEKEEERERRINEAFSTDKERVLKLIEQKEYKLLSGKFAVLAVCKKQ